MVLLDTNVLSAMMSARPERNVVAWLLEQSSDQLFTATVCQAEILSGIAIMPNGRRRTDLEAAARAMFAEDFLGRILPFDTEAAACYAALFAVRRQSGRPSGMVDLMLAGIACVHGASVATRNLADFEGLGVTIIDPWTRESGVAR